MYELVLIENKIYDSKKAGKVILFFPRIGFTVVFNEDSQKAGGDGVNAQCMGMHQQRTSYPRIYRQFCSDPRFLEYLATFELIDKAQGNDGVWCWEKVNPHFFFENSSEITNLVRCQLCFLQSTV